MEAPWRPGIDRRAVRLRSLAASARQYKPRVAGAEVIP
ncbi:hypothetical protein C4K09_2226 [Pseudomonas chlororaphis subsp. aureofaciens]|nr:hypothetical protein C4K14_2508 [Pseudomonas chlororaphis subsp. aureofaciens]AZE16687.1 hypothetical protein C4K09_2226 [Pseudomonas chlororaphis subsp. aureofaciens]AZE22824.1 hypothetical protein C4K08_2397 [Pseudomonas chlororaphis subsp. aureofaciens]